MAGGFGQYLRDTRAELRHVAWPTRMQTMIYTALVVAISIGVAAYLGFFDFAFTGGLTRFLGALPQHPSAGLTQEPVQVEFSTSSVDTASAASSTTGK